MIALSHARFPDIVVAQYYWDLPSISGILQPEFAELVESCTCGLLKVFHHSEIDHLRKEGVSSLRRLLEIQVLFEELLNVSSAELNIR